MSGLTLRAKYKHFNTICEQTSDNSPTDSGSSFLMWWSSKAKTWNFEKLLRLFFVWPIDSVSPRIVRRVLPCRGTTLLFLRDVCPILVILQLLLQKYVIRTCPCIDCSTIYSFGSQSRWVHPKKCYASFLPFWWHPRMQIRTNLNSCEMRMSIQVSFERNYVCNVWRWLWSSVSWNTHPCVWTFRFGSFQQLRSIVLGVSRSCVCCLSITIWWSRIAMTSMTFAAVICDADEPHSATDSSFTMFPQSTTLPLYFLNCGSNSEFFRWQR